MANCVVSLPRAAALSVAITVFASSIAAAQTLEPTPPAGDTAQRVLPGRVTSMDDNERKGTLLALSATEVVLDTRDGEAVMPLDQVQKVEKAAHRVRKGAVIGLLVGTGVGVLLNAATQGANSETHRVRNGALAGVPAGYVIGYLASCGGGDENDCWPEIGALGAGIGAGVGAAIGYGLVGRDTAAGLIGVAFCGGVGAGAGTLLGMARDRVISRRRSAGVGGVGRPTSIVTPSREPQRSSVQVAPILSSHRTGLALAVRW